MTTEVGTNGETM